MVLQKITSRRAGSETSAECSPPAALLRSRHLGLGLSFKGQRPSEQPGRLRAMRTENFAGSSRGYRPKKDSQRVNLA
jgi:hypothetical protein